MSSKFNAALDVKPQGFCAVAPQPQRKMQRKSSVGWAKAAKKDRKE
jgi:hypothetical protein